MRQEAKQLRDKLTQLKKDLSGAEQSLNSLVKSCNHQYGETIYDPIHTQSYTIPGDKPGTMGVDWRGPTHVPTETKKRWKISI